MKKLFIAAVALLCLSGTAVAQRHIEFRWHGLYLVGDMSYYFNVNRSADQSGVADTVGGIMPSFSVGYSFRKEASVGLGFSYFAEPTGAFRQLPLYVELRSHFMRSRLTPYTVLQVGYSLPVGASSEPPVTKIDEGGVYFGLEVGGRYAINRSLAVALHAGYKLLQSNKVQRDNFTWAEPKVLHLVGGGVSFYFGSN
ncbi:MAG: hypothetical protein ACSW8I_08385 [bacterium]